MVINVLNTMQQLHQIIKKWENSGTISKIILFINEYNWKDIKYLSRKHDWKIFEKNNPIFIPNVLHAKNICIYMSLQHFKLQFKS